MDEKKDKYKIIIFYWAVFILCCVIMYLFCNNCNKNNIGNAYNTVLNQSYDDNLLQLQYQQQMQPKQRKQQQQQYQQQQQQYQQQDYQQQQKQSPFLKGAEYFNENDVDNNETNSEMTREYTKKNDNKYENYGEDN